MEFHTNTSSLLKAVYLSRLRLTRLLLEGGAYVNESNEDGETPLMVACKTQHVDSQSVDKAKMVRYLLESGADPNIQDKRGRTALMHACLESAGVEVITLLLNSGADPSLEDHSGSSAIVYAVHSNDEATLRALLDACKARGKEVIIITTDKLPSGRQMTKQYLNVPPPLELEEGRARHPTFCMSPSDIELCSFSQPATNLQTGRNIFTLQNHQEDSEVASQPGSPSHSLGMVHSGLARVQQLQRLHSEPWLKIPPSLLEEHGTSPPLIKVMPDVTPENESSIRLGRRYYRVPMNSHNSTITKISPGLSQESEQVENINKRDGRQDGWLYQNMSCNSKAFVRSQPDLHSSSVAAVFPADKDNVGFPGVATSSLRSIVLRKNIGVDHYGSDSQLSRFHGSPSEGHTNKRMPITCSSAVRSVSRDSLEKQPSMQEGRGSGALFNTHISHSRPGSLPPLNPHVPVPQIEVSSVDASSAGILSKTALGVSKFVPSAPSFPRDHKGRKMLMRRHSMHTEQIKQLGNFEEIFSH